MRRALNFQLQNVYNAECLAIFLFQNVDFVDLIVCDVQLTHVSSVMRLSVQQTYDLLAFVVRKAIE
jgi:hypothetical protein